MADSNIALVHIIEDIEDIIIDWALDRKDRDKYTVQILKNGLKFIQVGDMKYRGIEKSAKGQDKNNSDTSGEVHPERRCQAIYSTSFSNNTETTQTHRYKTDRCLKTSYSWSMTSGKTFSSRAGITFTPPNSCIEASVEFSKQTSQEHSDSHVFEKSRTNALESDIEVKPGKKVTVIMKIEEEDIMAEYQVKYRIEGGVKVLITKDKKDTSTKTGQAQNIFEGMRGFKITEATESSIGFVTFENRGVFLCRREISQALEFTQTDV